MNAKVAMWNKGNQIQNWDRRFIPRDDLGNPNNGESYLNSTSTVYLSKIIQNVYVNEMVIPDKKYHIGEKWGLH